MTKPLSPIAQAVLDAAIDADGGSMHPPYEAIAAATLRAVVDAVAPLMEINPQENLESHRETMVWGMNYQTQIVRQKLLTIIKELEETKCK
jgi:hypothetical protein